MRVSDKAIVLQTIKHGDKKHIVKLFTLQHGLLSVVAIASKAPAGKVRSAALMPLSLINCVYTLKENRELHQLTESSFYFAGKGFSHSISKLSIAQFINELLVLCFKEHTANPALFALTETCIKYLHEAEHEYLNLHLYFMLELSKYLGFEPHNNFSEHLLYFDCREGSFGPSALAFPIGLTATDSAFFSRCLSDNLLSTHYTLAQRKLLLDILLAYFRLHLPGFNTVKSLEVLQTILTEI